jgi:hypothetical protein
MQMIALLAFSERIIQEYTRVYQCNEEMTLKVLPHAACQDKRVDNQMVGTFATTAAIFYKFLQGNSQRVSDISTKVKWFTVLRQETLL